MNTSQRKHCVISPSGQAHMLATLARTFPLMGPGCCTRLCLSPRLLYWHLRVTPAQKAVGLPGAPSSWPGPSVVILACPQHKAGAWARAHLSQWEKGTVRPHCSEGTARGSASLQSCRVSQHLGVARIPCSPSALGTRHCPGHTTRPPCRTTSWLPPLPSTGQ